MKFNECKSRHFTCVYCLEFPNGMKYVGKTHDLSDRMSVYERFGGSSRVDDAIKEFGIGSVDIRVLARFDGLSRVDAELCLSILEIKYIRELDTIYPNGLNVSLGGELLGVPIEYLTTDANTIKSLMSGNKILLEYDVDGNFVSEYPSIARFAYEKGYSENSVREAVDKMRAFKGKHILRTKRYDYIPEKIEIDEVRVIEKVKYTTKVEERVVRRDRTLLMVPVIVYDLNGDFVGEYESNSAACRALYVSGHNMPLGIYKNGYIAFKKVSDDYPKKVESFEEMRYKVTREEYVPITELDDKPIVASVGGKGKHEKLRHVFAVNQYKLNGEFVARHRSIRDASDASNIPYCQIYNCVMGNTSRARGYIWKCADEEKSDVRENIKRRTEVDVKDSKDLFSIDSLNF